MSDLPDLRAVLLDGYPAAEADAAIAAYEAAGRLTDVEVARLGPVLPFVRAEVLRTRYGQPGATAATVDLSLRWARRTGRPLGARR